MHPPRAIAVTLLANFINESLAINFNRTVLAQSFTDDATTRSRMEIDATTDKDAEEKMLSLSGAKKFVRSMMGLPKDIKTRFLDKNAEPKFVYEYLAGNTVNDTKNVLASSRVQIVEMYILEYNKLNPNGRTYLIDVLRDVYGENGAVTVILNARDDRKTKELAIHLQTLLFQRWLNDEETTVSNLLKLLHLNNTATFDCERLKVLLEFVNVLARRHCNGTITPKELVTKVTANEQELVGIIVDLPSPEMAENLLFQSWVENAFLAREVTPGFADQVRINKKVCNLLLRYKEFLQRKT